jgi:hypothetical protein
VSVEGAWPCAPRLGAEVELTLFTKSGGPLTKHIYLGPDAKPVSDGAACVMAAGEAERVKLATIYDLAELISTLETNQAIALGTLRANVPDVAKVTVKRKLEELNGTANPDVIARTADYIVYREKQPAFVLIDYDTKGMPEQVKERIETLGGLWPALVSVLPNLASTTRLLRPSTSTGLYHAETGERFDGSGGMHVFLTITDGTEAERFLQTMHVRCWAHGLGWGMVGKGGQFLERSIVDRMVGLPERLVFEAAPIIEPPLAQNQDSRRPVAENGIPLDTLSACPPLNVVERSRFDELRAKERHRLDADLAKARDVFVREHAKRFAQRTGIDIRIAARVVGRQCDGVLLPDVELPFDDPDLAGATVADVMSDPEKFESATLADPLEGPEYGRCKAKVMRRDDGTPWVRSYAHGLTTYELRHSFATAKIAIEKEPESQAAKAFVDAVLSAALDHDELERLRNLAAERSGTGKRTLEAALKSAQEEHGRKRRQHQRERRLAERRDPRLRLPAPLPNAEWLPIMSVLNEVLGHAADLEPPMRDDDGIVASVFLRPLRGVHLLTPFGSNEEDTGETRLPPPEQPALYRLGDMELGELIERYIEFVDDKGNSVHLGKAFVQHFLERKKDTVLPRVHAIATLPIVLPDGNLLSGHGLDRKRGIVFRIPPELLTLLPTTKACTPLAVGKAMRFLCDEWLVDVKCDYSGKCVIISLALSVLERIILPERPGFIITAGQRGGGKTTTLNMISLGVLGHRATAAAWSPSDEERRKSLFALLGSAVPLILWDNIPRGMAVSCPHIEKALTLETMTDRVLKESRHETVPTTSIMGFTGNNVTAAGDLASRVLRAQITVDRPDPENRDFVHPDPMSWTEAHRGEILASLYAIMLGNPRLRPDNDKPDETRFKTWFRLVGSAVEFAAEQHAKLIDDEISALVADPPTCRPTSVSFKKLFMNSDDEDEQGCSRSTVINIVRNNFGQCGASASEITRYANRGDASSVAFLSALEAATGGKPIKTISPTVLTWRLKSLADAPVQINDEILVLKFKAHHEGGIFTVNTINPVEP